MSNAHLSPTAEKVLELLRKNKGMPYGASDVCEVADCSTGLADAGLIERQQSAFGTTTYIARK